MIRFAEQVRDNGISYVLEVICERSYGDYDGPTMLREEFLEFGKDEKPKILMSFDRAGAWGMTTRPEWAQFIAD